MADGGSTAHSCVSRREGLHVSDVGPLGLIVLVLPVADVRGSWAWRCAIVGGC